MPRLPSILAPPGDPPPSESIALAPLQRILEPDTSTSDEGAQRQASPTASPDPQLNQRGETIFAGPTVAFDSGKHTPLRCLHCHEMWRFPLPDTTLLTAGPSATAYDMALGTDKILRFLNQYNEQRRQNLQQWKREHQIEPGGFAPCMKASSSDAPHTSPAPPPNNKRKSDAPPDEAPLSSKLRKLSCGTPSPRSAQLTPPPEPPAPASPPSFVIPVSLHDGTVVYHPYSNDIVATILGAKGAPPPYFEPPPKDGSNMWVDVSRERRSAAARDAGPGREGGVQDRDGEGRGGEGGGGGGVTARDNWVLR